MAFGGGGGLKSAKSDINVTPLVDVVLVLLIIFLVAMPIVMKEIEIDVPKKTDEPIDQVVVPDQITVEITKGGGVLLNGVQIDRVDLATKLRDRLEHKREKVVFVDFDEATRYGDAVSVMDTCKGSGATTVALKMKDENAPAGSPPGGAAPEQPGAPPAPAAPAAPAAPVVTPLNK
jgi:biopolymer transport protein TolR